MQYQIRYHSIIYIIFKIKKSMLHSNPTLGTQPDDNGNHVPTSGIVTAQYAPATQSLKPPCVLIALLIFVILQAVLAIGVLVVKIVFNFLGFNETAVLAVDQPNCADYVTVAAYELKQLYIMKISLVMIAACILVSIIQIIIISILIHRSKRLSPQITSPLQLSKLYLISGPKIRAFLYILESIALLTIIVVLGYYLIYFIRFQLKSCSWVNSSDINLKILIVAAIAAACFIVAWVAWIIIVQVNLKNRSQGEKYLEQNQQQQAKKEQYQNVNNTQVNNTQENHNEQTKQQINQQPKNQGGYYRHYDPLLNKQNEKDNFNRTNTLDSQKYGYAIKPPAEKKNESYYYKPEAPNNYYSKESPNKNNELRPENRTQNRPEGSYNRSYENPIFNTRKQLYDSPYDRIQNGKYYEGERDRNNTQLKDQMKHIQQQEKGQEFRRSRYNQNPDRYSPSKENDNYFKQLSRYRLEKQEQQHFKPNQSRQILPESGSNASGTNNYEGATRPKLHSTYFRDENAILNKKKNQNSDEKRKRKGILNDYIRGKYADN